MLSAKVWYLVFFVASQIAGAASRVVPLSEGREKLRLPAYTSAERELLAEQALFVLRDLYVHRDLKIEHFGAAVDPLPRLARIKREAAELSNEALHAKISQVFLELHDLHTNYYAPAPLKCGTAFIPLRFQSVKKNHRDLVVVSQKLKLQGELAEKISIGDALLEVDGEPIESVIAGLARYSGGANEDASRLRSVQMLSLRSPTTQPLPANDKIVLTLSGTTGKYEKSIPWQTLLDEDCLTGEGRRQPPPLLERLNLAEDDYQKQFNRIFGHDSLTSRWPNRAAESAFSEVFETTLLNTPAGPLGYLRIKAFYWSGSGLDQPSVVEAMRRSIERNLSKAGGLVIDVRGNPGGLITLSEKIVQLFSKRLVEPTTVRMLANPLNEDIFLRANGQDNRWSQSVREAIREGARYAGPLAITPSREANDMGQIWFKPVVVLTDASCYSACDLFVSGMKDSGAGKVIGLHRTTGGGGANVMEYDTFRAVMAGSQANPFVPLPHRQNMRVSWRQSIRAGMGAGKLIEDSGIESDEVVPLTAGDIGAESKDLMSKLRAIIEALQPNYRAKMELRSGGFLILLANDETAEWIERVQGVDAIEVIAGGETVATLSVSESTSLKEATILIPGLTGEWRDQPVTLVGKLSGNPAFRVVREIKWRGKYQGLTEGGLGASFTGGNLGPVRTVLLHGPKNSGWQVVGNKLRVGKGPNYASSVHTRAYVPVHLGGDGGFFTFDVVMEAEDPHDSLGIYFINPDSGERRHVFAGSNIRASAGVEIALPMTWESADLVFEFESDENWNLSGPVLDNFMFSRGSRN